MLGSTRDSKDVTLLIDSQFAPTDSTIAEVSCVDYTFHYSSEEKSKARWRGLPASAAPRWTVRPNIAWGELKRLACSAD